MLSIFNRLNISGYNLFDTIINLEYFITTIVNFLIISFSIFLLVKYVNKINKVEMDKIKNLNDKFVEKLDKKGKFKKYKKSKDSSSISPVEPETKICPYCLTEIKYHATRCPNCTSELVEKNGNLEEAVIEEGK